MGIMPKEKPIYWKQFGFHDGCEVYGYGISGTRISRSQRPSKNTRDDLYFKSRLPEMIDDADLYFMFVGLAARSRELYREENREAVLEDALAGYYAQDEVAASLEKQTGIKMDKRKIVLNENIKNVGTYTATCKLGYEITAPLTVKIEEA